VPFRLMLELLSLLAIANGTPVLVNKLLGTRFAYPLDGGAKFFDGQPLFGSSKTIRGILVAVSMTTAVGTLFGMSWKIGFVFGTVAMGGDLFSSFLKRRLHFVAGDRATGPGSDPGVSLPATSLRSCAGFNSTGDHRDRCCFLRGRSAVIDMVIQASHSRATLLVSPE